MDDGTEFFELRDLLAPSTRYQLGAFLCISTEDSLRDPYHLPDGKPGDIGVEAGFQHPVVQPNWQPESRGAAALHRRLSCSPSSSAEAHTWGGRLCGRFNSHS